METAQAFCDQSEALLQSLSPFTSNTSHLGPRRDGVQKLMSNIKAEVKFLKKLLDRPQSILPGHINSSNVPNLRAIAQLYLQDPDHSYIYRPFHYVRQARRQPHLSTVPMSIVVDVVSESGLKWTKVKACSLKSLWALAHATYDASLDDSDSSCTSSQSSDSSDDEDIAGRKLDPLTYLIRQAKAFLLAASQNQVQYRTPQVAFCFVDHGLSMKEMATFALASRLATLGVSVEYTSTSNFDRVYRYADLAVGTVSGLGAADTLPSLPPAITTQQPIHTDSVNLDITTLIVLVSDMVHLFTEIPPSVYDMDALQLQRDEELAEPILPMLYKVLQGKRVFTTTTAFDHFWRIVGSVGGEREKQRARCLFDSNSLTQCKDHVPSSFLDIPPACDPLPFSIALVPVSLSSKFLALDARSLGDSKLQRHHIDILGTADAHKATTVTANAWMGRSLEPLGIQHVPVWIHRPRSLLERRWLGSHPRSSRQ